MLARLSRFALRAAAAAQRQRLFAASAVRSEHTLPPLEYAYDALEPHISARIMTLHHQKHHKAYVDGLNAAKKSYASTTETKDRIKPQAALKFNGGGQCLRPEYLVLQMLIFVSMLLLCYFSGRINHSLFWKNLAPASEDGGKLPDGAFKQALERDFGTVENFKKEMNAKTAAIQGSGWGWLGYNQTTEKLEIVTTPNQDPLLCKFFFLLPSLSGEWRKTLTQLTLAHVPIIGIDIWEHVRTVSRYRRFTLINSLIGAS